MVAVPPEVDESTAGAALRILHGEVQIVGVFDVADEIRLTRVEDLAARRRAEEPQPRGRLSLARQPEAIAFTDPPVTVRLADRTLSIDATAHRVQVRARFYDFGAVAIRWTLAIPSGMELAALAELSAALEEPECRARVAAGLTEDADGVVASYRDALHSPWATRPVEVLTAYVVSAFDRPVRGEALADTAVLARLVVGDRGPLSAQLRASLRATAVSYGEHDLVVLSYDQAFIYDPVSAEDVSALLEFALAQVLELGFYDALLDERLAEIAAAVRAPDRRTRRWGLGPSRFEALRREVLLQHVDLVQVLERVSCAVKVTDDFHYARIYRSAMRVFRAEELVAGTDRKLDLVFRTYSMLADEVDTHVAHRLEWIIIILILIEIVLGIIDRL